MAAQEARMAKPTLTSRLQQLPLSESALRRVLFALAAVTGLAAAAYIAIGMAALRAEPPGMNLQEERARLTQQIANRIRELGEELQKQVDDPHVRADMAAGAYAEAGARLHKAWPALSAVEVVSPRVEEVLAARQGADAYSRLALQAEAMLSDQLAVSVVGQPGALDLGLARQVLEDGKPLAVASVQLPLGTITDMIAATAIGGGLMELRRTGEVVFAHGNSALRNWATPLDVPGTSFQLALAVPSSASGESPLQPLGIGAALAVVTVLLGGFARRMRFEDIGADEPTLAQALAADSAAAPAAAAEKPRPAERTKPVAASLSVERSIFRAYDIRGVVGKSLDANVARLIGQAIGSLLREQGLREIVVGRDGRLSGPDMAGALIDGLRATGCDVIDIGQAATPVVYFASYQLHTGSCVAVTGSHNPPDYNGFKIVVGGETLSGDAIQDLYTRIAENRLQTGAQGGLQVMDVSRDYIDRISSDVQLERRMRVVVDCGNGVPGAVAPEVLEAIGAAAESLYCEVDGSFPNHHPDPSDPENLRDLITAVQRTGAELGLAFDGDGDRLGVVTRSGRIIYPDRVLMLFAQDVLSRNPGAAVIYDVKCTGHLSGQILRHGGSPIMWKTGHSLIKAKMRETAAELAGEMSGHFFFKERWFGFDDGIYAAARLLEILAADDRDPEEIFAELPDSVSTPELKVEMEEGEHYAFMEVFRERARFEGAKIVTIDGVRADWPDGWGLVRCSNTTPCLVLRFDADSDDALLRIKDAFRTQIAAVRSGLALPF
jgi:phosphomannomutase / phosphoglucomutase